jgi:hypothetical protein
MATNEQIRAFFTFDESDEPMATDDQWIIPGREDVAIQVCERNLFAVNEYSGEGAEFSMRDHGFYEDLHVAMRKALDVAGIDPDTDPVPEVNAPTP